MNTNDGMKGSYLGPEFDQKTIEAKLKEIGAKFEILEESEIYDKTTDNLINGDAVGWFQGRMEFGPRALGARSILGDPRSENMQKNPKYKNVLLDIYDFFEQKIKFLRRKGINHNNIILDPGIGFGKNLKHNMTIIKNISIYHSLGLPILLGISRKKFIKELSFVNDSSLRIGGSMSSSIYAMMQGVQVLRIHDVNEVNQGIKVFKELIK